MIESIEGDMRVRKIHCQDKNQKNRKHYKLKKFIMPLSHILNGIYSTVENPMDVTNGTFQKAETKRKKQVQNVQTEELQTQKGKDIQKSTQIHKKVTFKNIYISQLNFINKLSLMRMLLLLVYVQPNNCNNL